MDRNDLTVSSSRLVIPRVAPLDAVVLAAILVGLNFWIAPIDPGWLKLNPSPYLLLPILIGGRFGFLPGIGAGVLSVAIVTAGQSWLKKIDPVFSLTSERYLYSGLILAGGICGELQHVFTSNMKRLA